MSFECNLEVNVDGAVESGGGCGQVDVNHADAGGNMGGNVELKVGVEAGGIGGKVHVETPQVNMEPVNIKVNTPNINVQTVAVPVDVNLSITSSETHVCGLEIPCISPTQAIVVLVLNILWPGLGTMVLPCMAKSQQCCQWFLVGLAQDFLGYVCIGWIWGIIMSMKVIALSEKYVGPDAVGVSLTVGGPVGTGVVVGGSVGTGVTVGGSVGGTVGGSVGVGATVGGGATVKVF